MMNEICKKYMNKKKMYRVFYFLNKILKLIMCYYYKYSVS